MPYAGLGLDHVNRDFLDVTNAVFILLNLESPQLFIPHDVVSNEIKKHDLSSEFNDQYLRVLIIFAMNMQVANLQEEIENLGTQMANLGVGVPSWRNSFVPDNSCDSGPHFSENDAMDMQFYLNHLQDPLLPQAEAATTTNLQTLESSMNEQFPPFYGWEDQNPFCDNCPILLERLFEGVDREVFSSCPWLNSGNGLGK